MRNYGDKKYGLTGTTGGEYLHYDAGLTPFAGRTIQIRLRYATDRCRLRGHRLVHRRLFGDGRRHQGLVRRRRRWRQRLDADVWNVHEHDGQPLGTGNPGDDGVAMGVGFQLASHNKDNTWAIVTVTPPQG
jgi:hypothetical protein